MATETVSFDDRKCEPLEQTFVFGLELVDFVQAASFDFVIDKGSSESGTVICSSSSDQGKIKKPTELPWRKRGRLLYRTSSRTREQPNMQDKHSNLIRQGHRQRT